MMMQYFIGLEERADFGRDTVADTTTTTASRGRSGWRGVVVRMLARRTAVGYGRRCDI